MWSEWVLEVYREIASTEAPSPLHVLQEEAAPRHKVAPGPQHSLGFPEPERRTRDPGAGCLRCSLHS